MKRNVILIADDMEINRTVLSLMFEEQYEVVPAENGQVCIEYLETNAKQVACLLLDLMMPIKNGFDVMEYMKEKGMMGEIPIILITGDDSKETEEIAYDYGASDVIYKPYVERVVMRRVKNVVDLYMHKNKMDELVREKTVQLEEQAKKMRENMEMVFDATGKIIEYRTNESKEHTKRIKMFTRILLWNAKELYPELELTDEKIDSIVRATALHDIGKLGVPDSVLLKREPLTKAEEKIMQSHTTIGCEILGAFNEISDQEFYKYSYEICRYHHERWDGGGYPDKISGDKIPFCAQIVALVDAYESLVSAHAYHTPFTHKAAVETILNGELGEFSPKALECFKLAYPEFEKLVDFSDNVSFL